MSPKYESDMTQKEKRAQELQKIKSLKGKKRVEYLWTYYRSFLLILLVFVFVICLIVPIIQNIQRNPVLTLALVDANLEADTESLEQKILNYLDTSGKHDEVVIDTTATSSGSYVKLATLLLAESDTDAVICNSDTYEFCKQKDCFIDWQKLLGNDYSDYEMYMTDGVIDLSKIPAWQEENYTLYEPVYLGVLQNSEHPETVLLFLEYLTQ